MQLNHPFYSLYLSLLQFGGYKIIKGPSKGVRLISETDLKTTWDNTIYENIHII